MKFKDYYSILGVERGASAADVKKAYRALAQKYHPDVSKEADAEARFKEIAEAYQTLKDPAKRAAYDELGAHSPGEEFRPPPNWGQKNSDQNFSFEDLDLADLFAGLSRQKAHGARHARQPPIAGQDYEVSANISIEDAYQGALLDLNLSLPDYDDSGRLRRVAHALKARIPKGATDGQRLRLPGKGGRGVNGGRSGDLYLTIVLNPHSLFRVSGHDVYVDLPLSPWEAALGATVEVPTLGGTVQLKVPAGTAAGQALRLAKRGLPLPRGGSGDQFAIAKIVLPKILSESERKLFEQLADISEFAPRANITAEPADAT